MLDRTLLMLTAAVTPRVTGPVAVSDPLARLAQYQVAVARWADAAQRASADLVVLETSGTYAERLLDAVEKACKDRVRVLTIEVPHEVTQRGKGAAEFHAIETYMNGASEPHATVYKATGRLVVRNVERLVAALDPGEVRIRSTVDRSFADTRFFGAGQDAWSFLLSGAADLMDDRRGVDAEHVIAGRVALGCATKRLTATRFVERAQFAGQSGSTGATYRESVFRRMANRPIASTEGLIAYLAHRKQV